MVRLAKFIRKEQWLDISASVDTGKILEILESTQSSQWKQCPGLLNPAEDGTRVILISEISNK